MIIAYSQIIGLPIADILDEELIGHVFTLIFDPKNISVVAFGLKSGLFFAEKFEAVAVIDVIELAKEGLVINSADSILPLLELPRVQKLWEDGYVGIGQQVWTKSGTFLGLVADIFIDSQTFAMTKILVNRLTSERIITRDLILDFSPKKIVVKDDLEPIPFKESPASVVAN